MSEQHAPLPWRYARDAWEGVEAADGTGIAMWNGIESIVPREADAEFIVRCVNSHDAVVAALNTVTDMLAGQRDFELGNAYPDEYAAVDAARAALALAEGKGK